MSRKDSVAAGLARGVVGAMAMTGLRQFTTGLGLVKKTPPDAVLRKSTGGLIGLLPKKRRQAGMELAHWAFGGVSGAVFGALPENVRSRRWAGPVYGLAIWLSFELAIAPVLGLKHAKRPRPLERVALAGDHVLYGLVIGVRRDKASSPPPA